MSLKSAVLSVVEGMLTDVVEIKEEGDELSAKEVSRIIRNYTQQLKCVCDAAEDNQAPNIGIPFGNAALLLPLTQHALEIEKAKREFRKPNNGNIEEQLMGGDMVQMIGGPADPDGNGTYQAIDPSMPIGARTMIAGAPYKLVIENNVRSLVYDGEELNRLSKLIIS